MKIPKINERWHHQVFGVVSIIEDKGDCVLCINSQGERRLAIGYNGERVNMLRRFEEKLS